MDGAKGRQGSEFAGTLELETRCARLVCDFHHLAAVLQFLLHQLCRLAGFSARLSSLAQAGGRAFASYSSVEFLSATARLVSSDKGSGLERRIDPGSGGCRRRRVVRREEISAAPF